MVAIRLRVSTYLKDFRSTDMELEGKDKTERFIMAAKERARSALNQEYQKLTCLEKGMLEALKNGSEARSIHNKRKVK